jgi:hypothetical protein
LARALDGALKVINAGRLHFTENLLGGGIDLRHHGANLGRAILAIDEGAIGICQHARHGTKLRPHCHLFARGLPARQRVKPESRASRS